MAPRGQHGAFAPSHCGTTKERLRQRASLRAGGSALAFFGQVQQLHLLLPLLRERQVVPVLCVVFQQREIWGRLGASGATFFSETFSVVWLYRALLPGTAEERQAVQRQSAECGADETERQVHPAGLMRCLLPLPAAGGQ